MLKAQHIQNLLNMLFEGIRINQTVKGDEKQLKDYVQQGNNTRLNYSYNNMSFHYQNQITNKTDDKVAMYDGFRLFWIIDKFLNGQVFPYGKLDEINYSIFVQTITLWLFGGSIVSQQRDKQDKYDPDFKYIKRNYKSSRADEAVDKLERLLKFSSEKMFILLSQFFEQEIQIKIMDMNSEYRKQFGANQLFQIIQHKCQVLGLETQFLCFFIPNILKHNKSSSFNYQGGDEREQSKQDKKQKKQLVKIQNSIYLQSLKKLLQSYSSAQMKFLSFEDIQENAKLMLNEISDSLRKQDLNELSQLTSVTPFVELRLLIFDLNQEYIKGLETCLNSQIMKQKLFRWLDQVLQKLKQKQKEEDQKPGALSASFLKQQELNRKILSCLRDLVKLDPQQTVHIIDKWFKQLHQKIIDQLQEAPQLQLKYLEDFLHRKQQHIIQINAQIRGDMKQKQQYEKYLLRFLQLLCIQAPSRVLQYAKKQYFPATLTLQIVVKHNVHDAAAMLYKKTGQLELSILYYLKYLDGLTPGLMGGMTGRKYQYDQLCKKHTFVKCSKEQAEQQMIHCSQQFSVVLTKIGKICLAQKDGPQAPDLWFKALSGIFKMKQKARKILVGDKEEFQQQLDQNISAGRRVTMRSQHSFLNSHLQQPLQPPQLRKKNFSVMSNQQAKAQFQLSKEQFELINGFFQNKIHWLTEKMSTTVKLQTILKNIIEKLSYLPYKEFKLLIENMIASYFQHQKIMHSAKQLLRRDIGDQTSKFLSSNRKGCVVFGPPAVQIQDARNCQNIKIHNNGASYAIWSSKSVSLGYAEDLVINSKQRVF